MTVPYNIALLTQTNGGLFGDNLARALDDDFSYLFGLIGGGDVVSVNGLTGIVVLTKADIGLSQVDNTSDADKPVSTDQAAAIGLRLLASANLNDLTSATAARGNLGLGTSAVFDVGISANRIVQLDGAGKLPAVDGSNLLNLPAGTITGLQVTTALGYVPTSVTTLTGVQTVGGFKAGLGLTKSDVGLSNVDNTSDANKPVSTAQGAALALKLTASSNLSDLGSATTARTNLGLGNVDNTSDINKPVSIATAAAIAAATSGDNLPTYIVGAFGNHYRNTFWAGGQMLYADDLRGRRVTPKAPIVYNVGPFGSVYASTFWQGGKMVESLTNDGRLLPASGAAAAKTLFLVAPFGTNYLNTRWYAGQMVFGATPQFLQTGLNTPIQLGQDIAVVECNVGAFETRVTASPRTLRNVPQVFWRGTNADYIPATFGPYPAAWVSTAGNIITVRDGNTQRTIQFRSPRLTTVPVTGTMYLIIIWGQSLAQGFVDSNAEVSPVIRDFVSEHALMFDSTAYDGVPSGPRPLQVSPVVANHAVQVDPVQFANLAQLYGSTHRNNGLNGSTSAETCGGTFVGCHLDPVDLAITTVIGTGATALQYFLPTTAHYLSMTGAINAAAAQAALRGMPLVVVDVMNQGEEDNAIHTPQATYVSEYGTINSGLQGIISGAGATYGGSFIQQCCQRDTGAVSMATLAHAQIILAGTAVGIAQYSMTPGYDGGTHLLPLTYLPLGAETAHVISEKIANPSYQCPLVPAGNAILQGGGTSTKVTFTGGNGTMVFDTTTIPNANDGFFGFDLNDSGGVVALSSVTKTGAMEFTITHAATVLGNTPILGIGIKGGASPPPNVNGARVNVRDTSGWTDPVTGQIACGWPIEQFVTLT